MGQLGFRNGEEQREGEEASRRELSPFYSSRSPRHRGAHGFLLPRSINADGSQLCLPPAPADARRQVGEEESEAKQGRERMDNACRIRARSLNGLPRQRNSPPFLKGSSRTARSYYCCCRWRRKSEKGSGEIYGRKMGLIDCELGSLSAETRKQNGRKERRSIGLALRCCCCYAQTM